MFFSVQLGRLNFFFLLIQEVCIFVPGNWVKQDFILLCRNYAWYFKLHAPLKQDCSCCRTNREMHKLVLTFLMMLVFSVDFNLALWVYLRYWDNQFPSRSLSQHELCNDACTYFKLRAPLNAELLLSRYPKSHQVMLVIFYNHCLESNFLISTGRNGVATSLKQSVRGILEISYWSTSAIDTEIISFLVDNNAYKQVAHAAKKKILESWSCRWWPGLQFLIACI